MLQFNSPFVNAQVCKSIIGSPITLKLLLCWKNVHICKQSQSLKENLTITKYYSKTFSIFKYFCTSVYYEQVKYVPSFAQLIFITILY